MLVRLYFHDTMLAIEFQTETLAISTHQIIRFFIR